MLLCADGKYYTGVTNNVRRRLAEHQDGIRTTAFTHPRRPVELVYVQEFQWIQQAMAWEKQVKGWKRAKKEALIRGDLDALHELASGMNSTSHGLREGTES